MYHSLLLKYCSKRLHFGYKVMIAQTQLAALDHNNNVDRSQATTAHEQKRYKVVFPKAKKQWIAKPIMEPKSYGYLNDMLAAVLERRSTTHKSLKTKKAYPPQASIPPNIATCPRLPEETVKENYKSRF